VEWHEVGEICIMRSSSPNIRCNWNDQVKEDEIGRICSSHEGEEKYLQGFGEKVRMKETIRKT
jgi:hypothetical protein